MNKIKLLQKIFIIMLSAAFLILTVIDPTASKKGITDGLLLCGSVIIPSLFPFTVFSLLIYNTLCEIDFKKANKIFYKIFHLNVNAFLIFLMSMFGGYPVGAKLISKACKEKSISTENANILLPVCVNAGPSFVIIAVGYAVLNSITLGTVLLLADLLACIQIYLFVRNRLTEDYMPPQSIKKSGFAEIFVNTVADSSAAILNICAFTTIFSCIINTLKSVLKNKTVIFLITYPLEVSNTALNNKNIYLLAFIIGFGGICVIFQIISISSHFYKKIGRLFIVRIIHGVLAVFNTAVIIKIFKITVPTISNTYNSILRFNTLNTKLSVILTFLALLLLISVSYKKYSGVFKKDIL